VYQARQPANIQQATHGEHYTGEVRPTQEKTNKT